MVNPFNGTAKRRSSRRLLHLAVAALLIAAAVSTSVVASQLPTRHSPIPTLHSQLATPDPPLTTSDLWIDMLIGPPLVPLFNGTARADDIARVDHPSQISQLDGITGGQKLVVFRSVTEAEQLLPGIADQIDIVGYNLEHGPATPPEEQDDPVASIERMRALADTYSLALALGPDHDFAISHGAAMAPYVDIFVLQIQRQQTNPPIVIDFIASLVPELRAANPALQISAQVRTEGDMAAIVQLLDTLLPYIDGVSILTSPETVLNAVELLFRLRSTAVYLPIIS